MFKTVYVGIRTGYFYCCMILDIIEPRECLERFSFEKKLAAGTSQRVKRTSGAPVFILFLSIARSHMHSFIANTPINRYGGLQKTRTHNVKKGYDRNLRCMRSLVRETHAQCTNTQARTQLWEHDPTTTCTPRNKQQVSNKLAYTHNAHKVGLAHASTLLLWYEMIESELCQYSPQNIAQTSSSIKVTTWLYIWKLRLMDNTAETRTHPEYD